MIPTPIPTGERIPDRVETDRQKPLFSRALLQGKGTGRSQRRFSEFLKDPKSQDRGQEKS